MALTIRRTGADEYGQFMKVLVCGDPGAGKTRSASTWPNVLIASVGANLMSVADRGVNFVDISSTEDLAELRVALANPPEVREELFGFKVDTVVIDTLDHFQEVMINERKAAQKIAEFGPSDWGWINDELASVVRGFRNLPLHVVFHLHLKLTEDQLTGQVYFRPSLIGQMGDKIAAYVDFALAFKGGVTLASPDGESQRVISRWAQTFADEQHPWVRDNSGKLPPDFPINFTDDFTRLNTSVYAGLNLPASANVAQLKAVAPPVVKPEPAAVVPLEAKAKQAAKAAPKTAKPPVVVPDAEAVSTGPPAPAPAPPVVSPVVEPVPAPAEDLEAAAELALVAELVHEDPHPPLPIQPPDELAAKRAADLPPCSECSKPVETADQVELSSIRFRRPMCRACFATAKRNLATIRA